MATVPKSDRTTIITLASAIAGPFKLTFRLFDDDALAVFVNDLPRTDFTITSSYTDGYDDDATITFNAALEVGDVVRVHGDMTPARSYDYTNGPSLTEKLNIEFGRLWGTISDMKRDTKRSAKFFQSVPPIPLSADRAIVGNEAGDGLRMGPSVSEIESAQGYSVNASTKASEAAASAIEAALYDGPKIDAFPELASVTAAMVDVGGLLRCIELGVVYERAADATPVVNGYPLDYSGSGGLKWYVVGGAGPVPVEAFGAHLVPISGTYTDSYAAIQAAWDWSASERGQAVLMQGDYAITQRLTKAANAQIVSDRRSVIRPLPGGSGAIDGILIDNGNHLGKTVFPQLSQFTGIAFEVQGDIGHFYVPQVHTCGTAFKINAGATDTTILDVELHFDAIANCTWPFEIASANPTDVIQGLHIKGNFITATTNCLKRTGVGSFDDGMVFDILAIDFTAGGGVFMDNQIAGHAVPRATVKVTSWIGGTGFTAGTPTKLFQGRWDTAEIDLCNAAYFNDDHQSTELVRASKWKLRRDRAVGSPINLVELAAGLAGFNGGKMISETNLLVKYTLPVDIGAGQLRSAYLYHCLADGNYQRFSAQRHQGGNGIIVEAVHDQSTTSTGRIALIFRNVSSVTVTAGTEVFVAVRRH